MYDPAIYYTPPEVKDITGKEINVRDIIEKPAVYLLGRARDTVRDKLSFIDTRMEDIEELSTKLKFRNWTEITDVMRFFSGDHPELCTEKGQQEGGHFPCAGCTCKPLNMPTDNSMKHWRNVEKRYPLVCIALTRIHSNEN